MYFIKIKKKFKKNENSKNLTISTNLPTLIKIQNQYNKWWYLVKYTPLYII